MSYAVKGVSTERGLDVAAFPLIAYGGAGPLHASAIAREIGIGQIIIPCAPGHFCAFGMLHSDLRYDLVRTLFRALETVPLEEIERAFGDLVADGRRALLAGGVRPAAVTLAYSADMRYVGQEHPVTVHFEEALLAKRDRAAIKRQFDHVHQQRYGTCAPAEKAEIVTLRAAVAGVMKKPPIERIPEGAARPPAAAERGKREVYFGGSRQAAGCYARDALLAGNRIAGPALIEEHASTTVVMPGDRVQVDPFGNLRITIEGTPS